MPKKADTSVSTRLQKSLDYLDMVRTSRVLAYGAYPYVIAAEALIKLALQTQADHIESSRA